MNTIFTKKNIWRGVPLGIAILIWLIALAIKYYDPISFSICDSFHGQYCLDAIGIPLLSYGQWLIASALIIFFVRDEIIKRWSIFAAIYLLLTIAALGFTNVSAGGIGFQERAATANLFGMLFLAITIIWVIAHTIILRRRENLLRKRSF